MAPGTSQPRAAPSPLQGLHSWLLQALGGISGPVAQRPCTQRHPHHAESWSSPYRLELSHRLLPRLSVLYIWADVLPLHWVHGEHSQRGCPLAKNASTSGEANGQLQPACFVAPLLLQAVQGDGA